MARPDCFISADVEADGPIPGTDQFSMLSFGLTVAGRWDGTTFTRAEPGADTFYAELRPISGRFDPAALAVSGLDRDALATGGLDPAEAMTKAAAWVRDVAGDHRPVMVAYPAVFDWMWLAWYFGAYAANPFGHSGCMDIKTLYQARSGARWGDAVKRRMPRHLMSDRPHTHNALDDAVEQAELFANLWAWDGAARGATRESGRAGR
jgi:hypothetical protein